MLPFKQVPNICDFKHIHIHITYIHIHTYTVLGKKKKKNPCISNLFLISSVLLELSEDIKFSMSFTRLK